MCGGDFPSSLCLPAFETVAARLRCGRCIFVTVSSVDMFPFDSENYHNFGVN